MELIFLSALCSVGVSILLKWLKTHGLDPKQMVVWNYVSASVLCFLWFKPDFSQLSAQHTPWWLIIILGVLLPSIFLCLSKALHTAGIVKTELAQRLSVILSLCAAYVFFQEILNSLKIAGIILGLLAIFCIFQSKSEQQNIQKNSIWTLLAVWFGYALVDILLKYTSSLGFSFPLVLNLVFITAFVLSLIYVYFYKKQKINIQNVGAGLVLGSLNFANIALYIKAHMMLQHSPAIVFAGMNILVVLFGVASGLILFKESIKPLTLAGIGFGLFSLLCLAQAM